MTSVVDSGMQNEPGHVLGTDWPPKKIAVSPASDTATAVVGTLTPKPAIVPNDLVVGSYMSGWSAKSAGGPSTAREPPATSTLPVERAIALCHARSPGSAPASVHVLATGS